MTKRRPSSARWMEEHRNDPYVIAAHRDGYRSRAAYKLLELNEAVAARCGGKGLIRPGDVVVDLGAAPGGWTQVAARLAGEQGRVVAVDLLPMESMAGAFVVCGDFLQEAVWDQVIAFLGGPHIQANVVLSDMAPNMTGIKIADQGQGEVLAESAFEFVQTHLRPGGRLVVKLFQGPEFHNMVRQARLMFEGVKVEKPPASRGRSAEHYLIGIGYRAGLPTS